MSAAPVIAATGIDMWFACDYDDHMTMLQIRNVPDELHRLLKARAAMAGMSLSEYALAELRRSAERPTRGEILARIAARPGATLRTPTAAALRAERDQR